MTNKEIKARRRKVGRIIMGMNLIISIILMIGIAGSIETNSIHLMTGFIIIVVLGLNAFASQSVINKLSEKDDRWYV